MNNKKAFEVEFHWVFVLIAGALILGFFFMVAQKQKTASNERLALTLSTEIDAAFMSALQSKGTEQPMPLPSTGISFHTQNSPVCGIAPACDCNFYIYDRPTPFADKIMFTPNDLTAIEAILWTKEWKTPFRATNFFYMTTNKIKYVFVMSNDPGVLRIKNKILMDLPDTMEKQILNSQQEIDQIKYNFENTRIIFLKEEPSSESLAQILKASKGKQASVLHLDLNGLARFFTKKQNKNEFEKILQNQMILDTTSNEPAINEAQMYAAIFSESPHLYECQMKEAYKKLSYVTKIIKKRAEQITTEIATTKPQCTSYPTQTLTDLQSIAENSITNPAGAGAILPLAQQLQSQSLNLLISNCPGLY